jgi:hypothetical protein
VRRALTVRHLVAVTALLLAAGCGAEPGPEDAAEAYVRGLEAGDCEAVKAVVLTPAAIDCTTVTESAGLYSADGIDLDETAFEGGKVVDDSTTVRVEWGAGQPSSELELQRMGDDWLVVTDSAA